MIKYIDSDIKITMRGEDIANHLNYECNSSIDNSSRILFCWKCS